MSLPDIVSREQWLAARKQLLADEKEMTKAHDRLAAKRRMLPMVLIDKEYVFQGPDGPVTLLGMFDGRRQLILRHFMFGPDWEKGCPSCTAGADEMSDGLLRHLNVRETSFVAVARAPIEKLEAYKAERGWTFPFYSSYGSDFNYDFHVTLDESVAPWSTTTGRDEHEAAGTRATCRARSRSSSRARVTSCATATRFSTRTRRSPADPRLPAARTTSSI